MRKLETNMTTEQYDFLNTLEPTQDLIKLVNFCTKQKIERNQDAYNIMAQIGVNKNNKPVSKQSLLSLYKKTYDLMFRYISELQVRSTTRQNFAKLKEMYARGELKPNLSPEECRKFYFETCPQVLGEYSPLHAQNGEDVILNDGRVTPDFIHIYPFERASEINCRLYLNTTPDNSCKIGEYLLEECYNRHLRVYFKFDTAGTRNDSMLIYTNYQKVSEFVEILEQIKQQHPELFVGATKSGVLTAQVNDFISYGEEPEYKHSSFNAERAAAIDEFTKNEIARARIGIGYYSGNFTTRYGDVLNFRNYLIYRLKEAFLETLETTQANIKNNIFPKRINEANVKDYIEIETKIYNACKTQIPPFVMENIEKNVDKIISDLKQGLRPNCGSIEFRTQRTNLSMYAPDYAKKKLAEQGYLPYNIYIDYDIQKKLFGMFNVTERISKNTTLESLEPYFKKHHCSVCHPHLNTETEQKLNSNLNV